MKDKENVRREHLFVPMNERILILSLGLLLTSLAHGVTENGLGEDCRTASQSKDASSQSQEALNCAQMNPESGEKATDAKTTATGVTDDSAGRADSSTVTPQQSTELFISDIETPESAEGEKRPVSDRDLFSLGASSQHNSDDFDAVTYSLSYRNRRREWFWPWQEATSHGIDWGLDVDRSLGDLDHTDFRSVHVQGTLGTYLTSGVYLQAQVGQHDLQTDVGDRTTDSNRVTAMLGLGRDFSFQLETARDFIYPEGAVPGGITEQLTARDSSASLRWRPHQRLRILAQGVYRQYDDDDENISQQANLNILYGISPSWPWVWAGVGAQGLRYDKQVSAYWSPEEFTAYGLRFDSSFPLGERLSGTAAANLDKLDEDGSRGTGYFLQAGLQYRLYGELYARLSLTQSKSIQRTSTWSSNAGFFWLSGPLF